MEQWIAQRPWVLIAGVVALGYVLGNSGGKQLRMRSAETTGLLPFLGASDPYPRMRTSDFAQRYAEGRQLGEAKRRMGRAY